MSDLNPIVEIQNFLGNFSGHGVNHDNQKFKGEITLESIVGQKGVLLTFVATGEDGTIYHQEKSLISPSMDEKINMWNFNSNVPGLVPHELRSSEPTDKSVKFVFGFNHPTDSNAFREEITLELHKSGNVGYHYSWGLPQGDFKERSGLEMLPVDN